MKNKKPKSKINKWKLMAIISLAVNGLVALLLTIGLATPKSYVKASADFEYSYDASKIITSTNLINSTTEYMLYFDWETSKSDNFKYYFPTSNGVPSFEYWRTLPQEKRFTDENFSLYALYITSINISDGIALGAYGTDFTESRDRFVTIAKIVNSTGYIDFLLSDSLVSNSCREWFRNLFDGSISVTSPNPNDNGHKFVIGYFSQYSVQNIELSLRTGGYDLVRSIDFQSSFSFQSTMHSNYNFVRNNLIRSTGRLFNINLNYDYGYMFSLDGVVKVNDIFFRGLCFVWKPVNLIDYFSATLDGYVMTSVTANQNNTFYYYLDSICPYGAIASPIHQIDEFVWDELPIVYLHSDIVSTDEAFPPYTSEPTNTLKMTSAVVFTNNTFIVHKLNLFPYTLTYEGWTYNLNAHPSLNWSTYGTLFKPINHFYFNNGSVVLTEPSQNDIENSTNNITGVFALISGAFESLIPILSIMVLPNITLGVLIFIPLVLTIIIVVIKLVKR